MAPRSAASRYFLLCPVCNKTQARLPVHLCTVCMEDGTAEDIAVVMERAKKDAAEILASGRVFSYTHLQQIMDDADPLSGLLEELQRRHMVVTGVPPPLPNVSATTRSSTNTTVQPPETEGPERERSGSVAVSRGRTFHFNSDYRWKKSEVKGNMKQGGLYQRHSRDHPLLKEFAEHLSKDKHIDNFQQEVDNVARFLYYMDPSAPSLKFVRNRQKANEYFRDLSERKMKKQTQLNYLKNLKRFLMFHTNFTNLMYDDPKLHEDCVRFLGYIKVLQSGCSKQASQEITRRRYTMLTEALPTPEDCWAVLRAAKSDFLDVLGKVYPRQKAVLDMKECILVVYYLEAVVILKHLQRPGVVENMTNDEWQHRWKTDSGTIIGVQQHKTAAQQVATFILSQEEEKWFDLYYTRVRPQILSSRRCKSDGEGQFFVSSTGKKIYNASNDINKLHSKYKIKPINSQTARRVFESATATLDEREKSLVAKYLAHSNTTAEKHYRMKLPADILRGNQLLNKLAADSSFESADEHPSHVTHGTACSNAARSNAACSDTVRSDGARSDGARSNTVHSDGARSDTAHSDTARTNAARTNAAHTNAACSDTARTNAVRTDAARTNAACSDTARSDTARTNAARTNAACGDTARTNAARTNAARTNAARTNAACGDTARTNAVRTDAARTNAACSDTARTNAVRTDAARTNAACSDTAHTNAARTNAAHTNAACSDTARTNAVRTDAARTNAACSDTARTNAARTNAACGDTARTNAARTNAVRTDAARTNAACGDTTRTNAARTNAARTNAACSDTAHSGTAYSDAAHKPICGTTEQMEVQREYENLLKTYPVTVYGATPNKKQRLKHVSSENERKVYERWLKAQMKLRVKRAVSHFCRCQPSEKELSAWIKKQGWKTNIPTAARVIEAWRPSGPEDVILESQQIQHLIRTQKWSGLRVTEIDGKGVSIIATRFFLPGEVVCNYHPTTSPETQQTVGQQIRHSHQRSNLRPRMYTVNTDGEDKTITLFLASRRIEENEELLVNYRRMTD